MAVSIDDAGIEQKAGLSGGPDGPPLSLHVLLPSLDRRAAEDMVRAELGSAPTYVHEPSQTAVPRWRLYPTTGGPLLWIERPMEWRTYLMPLLERLDERGAEGRIVVAEIPDPDRIIPISALAPAAMLGFPIEPDYESGPLNMWGQPAYRWGVPEGLTEDVIAEAVSWASQIGEVGVIGGAGPSLPASPEDAVDLMRRLRHEGPHRVTCTFTKSGRAEDPPVRCVTLNHFGEVVYAEWNPERPNVELALELASVLGVNASRAEVGVVYLSRPLTYGTAVWSRGSRWVARRHLWSSHVYDAGGIQLVTTDHLANARDLSDWKLTAFENEHFLLTAPDLEAWYSTPSTEAWDRYQFPTPSTLESARYDFGDMILNDEVAAANPPRLDESS